MTELEEFSGSRGLEPLEKVGAGEGPDVLRHQGEVLQVCTTEMAVDRGPHLLRYWGVGYRGGNGGHLDDNLSQSWHNISSPGVLCRLKRELPPRPQKGITHRRWLRDHMEQVDHSVLRS